MKPRHAAARALPDVLKMKVVTRIAFVALAICLSHAAPAHCQKLTPQEVNDQARPVGQEYCSHHATAPECLTDQQIKQRDETAAARYVQGYKLAKRDGNIS